MFMGGKVGRAAHPEERFGTVEIVKDDPLFKGLTESIRVYQNHYDAVIELPQNFILLATNNNSRVEAYRVTNKHWWGTQLHPEIYNETHKAGYLILDNFFKVCV